MSRSGRRRRERRRPRGKANEKPRPEDDPFPSLLVEWGGELWFVLDYTAGGAPVGLRASEIEEVFEHLRAGPSINLSRRDGRGRDETVQLEAKRRDRDRLGESGHSRTLKA